jgi:hypothetical protein
MDAPNTQQNPVVTRPETLASLVEAVNALTNHLRESHVDNVLLTLGKPEPTWHVYPRIGDKRFDGGKSGNGKTLAEAQADLAAKMITAEKLRGEAAALMAKAREIEEGGAA